MIAGLTRLRRHLPARLLITFAGAGGCAVVLALCGWTLAASSLRPIEVEGVRGVGPASVVWTTVIATALTAILVMMLSHAPRPRRALLGCGLLGLALSFIAPVVLASDVWSTMWLCVLHLVVAGVLLPAAASLLPRDAPSCRRSLPLRRKRSAGRTPTPGPAVDSAAVSTDSILIDKQHDMEVGP